MQEWMIAMLVISVLLVVRDMAKTVLSGRMRPAGEAVPCLGAHPQKEKVKRLAASFRKLADTLYGMPYRKDCVTSGQVEKILKNTSIRVCAACSRKGLCWGEQAREMYHGGEAMIRALEGGDAQEIQELRTDWMSVCSRFTQYSEVLADELGREKQNLAWSNRMIDNRFAVAGQLTETARIIESVAEDIYDVLPAEPVFRKSLSRSLRKRHLMLGQAWSMDQVEGHRQVFLTLRARAGQCIAVSEAAAALSEECATPMVPLMGSRHVIGAEYHTIRFMEDISFQALYGVAKLTREKEKVSGDNYLCRQEDGGRFVMCLSDGCGSGMEACRQSEAVVELLEQFLDSGFSQETAARMVNSALLLSGREEMFSTVDICTVDLYTGIAGFLKAGAASTFIRREHQVEVISSESLAAGLVQHFDFETVSRKLYHGDYLIMMTDGVLDALPAGREEETMKEIILDIRDRTPRDISRGILERALGYSDYLARDDMTVLVAGIWKK